MRGLKEKDELYAEIADDGAVHVEKHFVGRLQGLPLLSRHAGRGHPRQGHAQCCRPRAGQGARHARAPRGRRPRARPSSSTARGQVLWREEEIARLEAGEDPLKPVVVVSADEHLIGPRQGEGAGAAQRLDSRAHRRAAEAAGRDRRRPGHRRAWRAASPSASRRTSACCGARAVAEEMRSLDQPARAQLRKYGVRFGAFNIYFPIMLKPACGRAGADAVGSEARRRARARHRRHARAAARRASHRLRSGSGARKPSIGSLASMSAGRARCASTCWSGWPTSSGRCWPGGPMPPIRARRRKARPATAASGRRRR